MVYDWFTMFLQGSALPVVRRWQRDGRPETGASGARAPLILALADLEAVPAADLPADGSALIVEGEVEAIEAASARLTRRLPDAVLLLRATPMAVQRLHVALGVIEAQAGAAQGRIAILGQIGADPQVFLGGTRYAGCSSRLMALVFDGARLRQRLSGHHAAVQKGGNSQNDNGLDTPPHSPPEATRSRQMPGPGQGGAATLAEAPLSALSLAQAQTLLMAADAGLAALLQAPPALDGHALAAHAQAARLAGFHGLVA